MNSPQSLRAKTEEFIGRKPVRQVLSILLFILLFDISLSVLWAYAVGGEPMALLGSSTALNLSNLMFIEGAIIFALGTFILFSRTSREIRRSLKESKEVPHESKLITRKSIRADGLLLLVGVILLGLSVIVGTLFV